MPAIAAAAIGAVGSIAGGMISSSGAQAAAQTSQQAQQWQQQAAQPFVDIGQQQAQQLSNELQSGALGQMAMPTAQNIKSMPGYQFTMQQGLENTQNAFAAQGLGVSGNALRGAAQFATGTANQYYQNYFNDYWANQQNRYNMLAGLAQLGEGAAVNAGTNIINAAGQVGAAQQNAANALGSGISGAASNALLASQQQANSANPSGGLGGAIAGLFGGGTGINSPQAVQGAAILPAGGFLGSGY